MQLSIEILDASKYILDNNKITWKRYSKKVRIFFLIFYFISISLFVLGMFDFSGYARAEVMGKSISYSNWHLTESLGFIGILILTYMLYLHFFNRKKYFKKVQNLANKYLQYDNKIVIQMDETTLKYNSSQINSVMRWTYFDYYTLVNNKLLLCTDGSLLSCITIDKDLISPEELKLLMNIVNKQVAYIP